MILGNWSDPNNWASGGVPTTGEVGGTIVQFNGTTSSTDDIPNLVVDQIHFTAAGNTIKGSAGISLGINGSVQNTNILNDTGANEIDVSLPLILSGNTTYTLITAGKVVIEGQISGNQGLLLPSASAGTLELASTTANTFTGDVTVIRVPISPALRSPLPPNRRRSAATAG